MTASSNSKHVGGCSPQRKCTIITPDARDHNTLPPGTAPTHMLAIARSGHICGAFLNNEPKSPQLIERKCEICLISALEDFTLPLNKLR